MSEPAHSNDPARQAIEAKRAEMKRVKRQVRLWYWLFLLFSALPIVQQATQLAAHSTALPEPLVAILGGMGLVCGVVSYFNHLRWRKLDVELHCLVDAYVARK